MNVLFKLFNVSALSADLDVDEVPPIEVLNLTGGAADTLYKGAIVAVGTDGYLCVVSDVTGMFPTGLMKKQVVVAGSNAENIEVLTGRFWIPLTGATQSMVGEPIYASDDATITPTASTSIGPLGMCVGFKTGYLLVDTRIKALE